MHRNTLNTSPTANEKGGIEIKGTVKLTTALPIMRQFADE